MADDKWVVFDFDNTIADALQAWISAYNVVAPHYGCNVIKPEDYSRLKKMSAWNIRKALNVSLWKAPAMRREIRNIFSSQIGKLKFYPGMDKVITELYGRGYHLGIFSSNTGKNLTAFLRKENFEKYFEFVEPEASLFYKGWQLKWALRKHYVNPLAAYYVGDETKDVDAARKAGMESVAVTWGVNSKDALVLHKADYLADTPEELLSVFK